jgi:hypothetical protein
MLINFKEFSGAAKHVLTYKVEGNIPRGDLYP